VIISDWITSFKLLFPEFSMIRDENETDVTDATLERYLLITMDMLPQGLVVRLPIASMDNLVKYATAHMLSYYNVVDGYAEQRTMLKVVTGLGANGLTTSYEGTPKFTGDMMPALIAFFNTTAYGHIATMWLEKMSGTVGGAIV
jgi:hypothetical protein